MNLDGKKDEIKHIELVVQNMLTIINKKGSLSIEDVSDLIMHNDLSNNKIPDEQELIVLHSHSGPIFARTKGQKKYYQAVLNNDIVSTRTLLHEAIPITGTIASGTYSSSAGGEENIKNYGHGMFQSVYDYPYLSSSSNHVFDITCGYSSTSALSSSANCSGYNS